MKIAVYRVLGRISKGRLSRSQAAVTLAVSERHVNRLMRQNKVRRPPSPVHAARAAATARRLRRLHAAVAVSQGRRSLKQGANDAGVSERTLYRWLKKLKKRQKPA